MYKITNNKQKSMFYYDKIRRSCKDTSTGCLAEVINIPKETIVTLIENTTNSYHPNVCKAKVVKWGINEHNDELNINIHKNGIFFIDTSYDNLCEITNLKTY